MDATQNSRRTAWISCILAALVLYVVTWPIVEIKFAEPHFTGSKTITRTIKSGADTYTTTYSAKGMMMFHTGPSSGLAITSTTPVPSRIVMLEALYSPLHKLRASKGGQNTIDPYYNWWLEALL